MQSSPLLRYQELTGSGKVVADAAQVPVIQALDALWRELRAERVPSFWQRLRGVKPASPKGLYIWGSVGRGKTWLMDLFYENLPAKGKQRTHFHRFMQRVHDDLHRLEGVQNPLCEIADDWSRDCRVLCLDEFFVSDIADAMLLATLLENLLQRGVVLVTTSNCEPDALYRDGLQRAKFLPAIALIKRELRVIELEGDTDYRLRILKESEIYHWPLDEQARQTMSESFDRMAAGTGQEPGLKKNGGLVINGRELHPVRRRDGVIWFEFSELCQTPRSTSDFIEIARAFNTVLLSDVPQLHEQDTNAVRRFINLVDEFYDRG